jgi:hypothetical protein
VAGPIASRHGTGVQAHRRRALPLLEKLASIGARGVSEGNGLPR